MTAGQREGATPDAGERVVAPGQVWGHPEPDGFLEPFEVKRVYRDRADIVWLRAPEMARNGSKRLTAFAKCELLSSPHR